jgi:transcription antitermination factor NusG
MDFWFALYVKPRHEKHVSSMLRGRGYEELVPLYHHRTHSRVSELPLFPGYVFCRFNPERRLPIVTIPGVFFIVGFSGGITPVEDIEILALRRIVQSGLPRLPWPELPVGKKVTLASGPLQGVQGVVMEHKNNSRLLVSVNLLQRSVAVEVDRAWLQ